MADGLRFGVTKLNNHNYQAWRFKMEMLLIREGTWSTISEDRVDPVTTEWTAADLKARATIGLCIEDTQTSLVQNCNSAKAAWDAIKNYHDKASEVYLLKKLTHLELKENDDMEEHLQIFTEISQRVAAVGDAIPERLQVAMLLCSLPDSYDPLATALEQRPRAELTMQLVKSKLLAEAEKRRERSGGASSSSGQALRVDRRRKKKTSDGESDEERVETRSCYICKQKGHLRNDCPMKSESAVPNKKKQQTQKAKQAQEVAEGPLAWMVGQSGPSDWYVDSGASRHMTGDRKFFTELEETEGASVMVADGKKADVAGKGRGIFVGVDEAGDPVEIQLNEVLYVPKLTSGLVSVSVLAKKKFEVWFGENKCKVRGPGGKVCAIAVRHGNLYWLCEPEHAMVSVQPPHTSGCLHTWHRRLGHRDPEMIRRVIAKHLADGMEVSNCGAHTGCECCLESKMSQAPFPESVDRDSKEKLDIVHAELSGPMKSTPSGNQYFLCLVDDFTRMAFVYLLAKKSDAAAKIKDFVMFCKTQFGKTPKVLQSDGGGEFTGNDLQSFLRAEGIVSQFSAPNSPQQNGLVERRSRHLKEMALCMLMDAKLDAKYWGEAILTATYIQNRVPTRATGISPYQEWCGRLPSFEHLRIFGCDAWVLVPSQKRKKMKPKARKVVLVGYSNQHKAYRLLNKDSGRITISRDVKFLEDWNMENQRGVECKQDVKDSTVELEPVPATPREVGPVPAAPNLEQEEEDLEGYQSAEDIAGIVVEVEPTTDQRAVSCAEKEEVIAAMDEKWKLVDPPAKCNVVGRKRKLDAGGKAVWTRCLLAKLKEKQMQPTVIYEDYRSYLDFVVMDQQKKRSKHNTKSCCSSDDIELRYCASESKVADILPKPLGATVEKFATLMGLAHVPIGKETGGD